MSTRADSRPAYPSDSHTIITVHRARRISGISIAGVRAAMTAPGGHQWIPLLVGEDLDDACLTTPPFAAAPHAACATWPADATTIQRVLAIRSALRDLEASIVLGLDSPLAYIAAALDAHRGTRSGLWHHSSGADGDDIVRSCASLCECWCAVSPQLSLHIAPFMHASSGEASAPGVPALPVTVEVPPACATTVPSERTLRIISIGRLEQVHKRSMDLATLADCLFARRVRFHLTIVGDGPCEARLRQAVRGHIAAGRVAMIGAVPPDRVHDLYSAHDLGLLVSRSEGAPLAVAECMAAGRPVAITTGCGGALDVVIEGETGLVVPVGDMNALADALATLATNRARLRAMGPRAHAAAREHFSPKAVEHRYRTFIESLTTAPPRCTDAASARVLWKSILQALADTGPIAADELETLRDLWLGELIEAGIMSSEQAEGFSTILPAARATSREMAMTDAMAAARANGSSRLIIYGGGAHTRACARVLEGQADIIAIADDAAGGEELTTIAGHRVVMPSRLIEEGITNFDAIIISSDEYQDDLAQRATQWCREATIIRPYSDSTLLPSPPLEDPAAEGEFGNDELGNGEEDGDQHDDGDSSQLRAA